MAEISNSENAALKTDTSAAAQAYLLPRLMAMRIFDGVSASALRFLAVSEETVPRTIVRAGALLYDQGAGCDRVQVLLGGLVHIRRKDARGQARHVDIRRPLEVLAMTLVLSRRKAEVQAEALTECEIASFSREDFLFLMLRERTLIENYTQAVAQRLRASAEHLEWSVGDVDPVWAVMGFFAEVGLAWQVHQETQTRFGGEASVFAEPAFNQKDVMDRLGYVPLNQVASAMRRLRRERFIGKAGVGHKYRVRDPRSLRKHVQARYSHWELPDQPLF